jgi:hypothetical protein
MESQIMSQIMLLSAKNKSIYNYPVSKTQTMREQQQQKRRPRFSIHTGIILRDNIQPVCTGDLFK